MSGSMSGQSNPRATRHTSSQSPAPEAVRGEEGVVAAWLAEEMEDDMMPVL